MVVVVVGNARHGYPSPISSLYRLVICVSFLSRRWSCIPFLDSFSLYAILFGFRGDDQTLGAVVTVQPCPKTVKMAQMCSRWFKTGLLTVARCEDARRDKERRWELAIVSQGLSSQGSGVYVEAAAEAYVQGNGSSVEKERTEKARKNSLRRDVEGRG
jgi:hypothetical protein